MRLFHSHTWKVVTITPEQPAINHIDQFNAEGDAAHRMLDLMAPHQIVTYRCEDCGTEKVVRL